MNTPLLLLKNITQSYGSGERRFVAVEDVNLTLNEGDFVALLGPSGCGKSTLLRIITGLLKASSGQVIYRDAPLKGVNPHASMVFQSFALFPWLTVLDNVTLVLKAKGMKAGERIRKAEELLDRVGLDGFESAYPKELSGGMRQKVGFARAMAVEPELLCLDEPFSALDVLSAESLRGELLELWLDGKIPTRTILMVSHNIEEAVFLSDRIVLMDKDPGRIVAEIQVNLPHPRNRKSPEFQALMDRLYAILAGRTRTESEEFGVAPGEIGRIRQLPEVETGNLAGFIEELAEEGNKKHDLFTLEDKLNLNSKEILRFTEAAELLGFATVSNGDIELTPLAQSYANANIQTRIEIFTSRIQRLPIIKWLLNMLQAAEDHQLKIEVIEAALSLQFSQEEIKNQIDTLIDWGRYGELFSYDGRKELIILEQ